MGRCFTIVNECFVSVQNPLVRKTTTAHDFAAKSSCRRTCGRNHVVSIHSSMVMKALISNLFLSSLTNLLYVRLSIRPSKETLRFGKHRLSNQYKVTTGDPNILQQVTRKWYGSQIHHVA